MFEHERISASHKIRDSLQSFGLLLAIHEGEWHEWLGEGSVIRWKGWSPVWCRSTHLRKWCKWARALIMRDAV